MRINDHFSSTQTQESPSNRIRPVDRNASFTASKLLTRVFEIPSTDSMRFIVDNATPEFSANSLAVHLRYARAIQTCPPVTIWPEQYVKPFLIGTGS